MGQLERQRLRTNLIDQVEEARRRIWRLEESAPASLGDGRLVLPGLVLQVLDSPPTAPAAGTVLVYAQDVGGTVYVRVMDAAKTVKDLTSWV